MPPAAKPLVQGVDFVSIMSKDYAAAAAFYTGVLGLEQSADYERAPGGEFETGNLTIQIIDAASVGQPPRAGGLIAFRVDDVDAARADLEAKGVEFVAQFDSGVCHQAIFHDPDGTPCILHHRYAPKG